MPTAVPPAIVTLASCPVAYSIARKNPLKIRGNINEGWSGEITFAVKAEDLYSFCTFAGGSKKTIDMGGGVTATRYIPLSHPDLTKLLCTRIDGEAIGGYTATNTEALSNWSNAFVTLSFTSVPYLIDGSTPFQTIEVNEGLEVYTLAGSKLKFPSDSSYLQADAGKTVGTAIYSNTIYLSGALNDGVINPLKGKCNASVLLGQPIGTLRFDTWSAKIVMTSNFETSYTRSIKLTQRDVPWNQFLRPDGVWEAPVKPDGTFVYDLADLSPLFS